MTIAEELALVAKGPVQVRIARDVVLVQGPDALTFLQGQVSQDLASLAVGQSVPSLLLAPQGKLEAWVRVSRIKDDEYALDLDAGFGARVKERLSRFLLRTKAEIVPVSWELVAVRGAGSAEVEGVATIVEDADWPGIEGVDLLGPAVGELLGVASASAAALEVLRIEAGVPRHGHELNGTEIPAETGLVERSVSFTKGCFVGQELVARIDSRGGNVPRHLRRLTVPGAEQGAEQGGALDAGAPIAYEGKQVGMVTSAAWHPGRGAVVALGYVARAVPANVSVDGGLTVGVDPWPAGLH